MLANIREKDEKHPNSIQLKIKTKWLSREWYLIEQFLQKKEGFLWITNFSSPEYFSDINLKTSPVAVEDEKRRKQDLGGINRKKRLCGETRSARLRNFKIAWLKKYTKFSFLWRFLIFSSFLKTAPQKRRREEKLKKKTKGGLIGKENLRRKRKTVSLHNLKLLLLRIFLKTSRREERRREEALKRKIKGV